MRRYVDLSEKVTATYYDDQYEEWTQQTVTIADVLDSVCDDYTVLSYAQPKKKLLFSERLQIVELYREWILRNGAEDCAESFLAYLIIRGYIDG